MDTVRHHHDPAVGSGIRPVYGGTRAKELRPHVSKVPLGGSRILCIYFFVSGRVGLWPGRAVFSDRDGRFYRGFSRRRRERDGCFRNKNVFDRSGRSGGIFRELCRESSTLRGFFSTAFRAEVCDDGAVSSALCTERSVGFISYRRRSSLQRIFWKTYPSFRKHSRRGTRTCPAEDSQYVGYLLPFGICINSCPSFGDFLRWSFPSVKTSFGEDFRR